MAWHLLEKQLEHSAAHSTLIGKWWIACVLVFRIIVVASVGDSVYSDEQDQFTCNTKQPGCKQVCYNMFAPISHIRFWSFQILATCTPTVLFIIFTMHKLAKIPKLPEGDDATKDTAIQTPWKYSKKKEAENGEKSNVSKFEGKKSNRSSKHSEKSSYEAALVPTTEKMEKICRENKVRRTKRLVVRVYTFKVFVRLATEVVFLLLQYYLYQLWVPEFYECIRYPCPKIVECYISRPMEKTIFLYFMFVVGIVCVLMNVLELKYLGYRKLKRVWCPVTHERFTPPSAREGTYPSRNERIITTRPKHAPPGYYIPDVDPPSQKYRSPNSGFPPIRVGAASFTTSESDLTSENDSIESRPIIYRR